MPGLTLTKPQAMRLFGVAPSVCAAMFRDLVMENFLSRTGEGVCAIDHTLTNEPIATACAWCLTGLEIPRFEQTSTASRRSLSLIPFVRGVSLPFRSSERSPYASAQPSGQRLSRGSGGWSRSASQCTGLTTSRQGAKGRRRSVDSCRLFGGRVKRPGEGRFSPGRLVLRDAITTWP
jgi:hypothetical protein